MIINRDKTDYPELMPVIFGISYDRDTRRSRITQRLKQRLDEGMIDEVKHLVDSGISPEKLEFYGLEYKYLTWYVTGRIKYEEMFAGLNTAIHRFAKRQMTWFRKMEREGTVIHWLDGKYDHGRKTFTKSRNPGEINSFDSKYPGKGIDDIGQGKCDQDIHRSKENIILFSEPSNSSSDHNGNVRDKKSNNYHGIINIQIPVCFRIFCFRWCAGIKQNQVGEYKEIQPGTKDNSF